MLQFFPMQQKNQLLVLVTVGEHVEERVQNLVMAIVQVCAKIAALVLLKTSLIVFS